jgi:cell division GTPase FtsZ
MKDAVRITVIATGFERSGNVRRPLREVPIGDEHPREESQTKSEEPVELRLRDFQPQRINTDDLDVPSFIRNRRR